MSSVERNTVSVSGSIAYGVSLTLLRSNRRGKTILGSLEKMEDDTSQETTTLQRSPHISRLPPPSVCIVLTVLLMSDQDIILIATGLSFITTLIQLDE